MSTCGSKLFSCVFCVYRSNIGIDFIKHLFEAHSLEPTFCYVCGISSCTKVFTTGSCFDAFRGHCIRKHHKWQQDFTPNLDPTQDEEDPIASTRRDCLSVPGINVEDHTHNCEEASASYSDVFNGLDADEQPSLTVQKESIKTDAAKFILALKETYKLTQASLDYTIKVVDKLMFLSSKIVEQSIAEGDSGQYLSPFDELQTEYQQTKYFKERFGLIVSVNAHVMYILLQVPFLFLSCRNR